LNNPLLQTVCLLLGEEILYLVEKLQ